MENRPLNSESVAEIIVPVYNEGAGIRRMLDSLKEHLQYPVRVLICYDFEEDSTLQALRDYDAGPLEVVCVRNRTPGPHGAVLSGFAASRAPCVITFPADDDFNAPRVNHLIEAFQKGNEIVVACRFMAGGKMEGCPLLKSILVRTSSFFMYHVAGVPTRDSSNGLRLFSRKTIETIPIESDTGFVYSIELLVKADRLGWPIAEVPFLWRERATGKSRFRTLKWIPNYLIWVRFALKTRFLNLKETPIPSLMRSHGR